MQNESSMYKKIFSLLMLINFSVNFCMNLETSRQDRNMQPLGTTHPDYMLAFLSLNHALSFSQSIRVPLSNCQNKPSWQLALAMNANHSELATIRQELGEHPVSSETSTEFDKFLDAELTTTQKNIIEFYDSIFNINPTKQPNRKACCGIDFKRINNYRYDCCSCKKTFSTYYSAQDHANTVHLKKEPYICACGSNFSGYNKYYNHKKNCLSNKKKTKIDNNKHRATSRKPINYKFQCDHCMSLYSAASSLTRHINAQHPEYVIPKTNSTSSSQTIKTRSQAARRDGVNKQSHPKKDTGSQSAVIATLKTRILKK